MAGYARRISFAWLALLGLGTSCLSVPTEDVAGPPETTDGGHGKGGSGGSPTCFPGQNQKLCGSVCVSNTDPSYGCASVSCTPCSGTGTMICKDGKCSVQAPANGTVSVSGSAKVGQTLSASTSGWAPPAPAPSYAWQWQSSSDGSSWTDISGATGSGASSTYTIATSDEGSYLRATVTATNGGGSDSASSSAVGRVAAAALTGEHRADAGLDISGASSFATGSFTPSAGRLYLATVALPSSSASVSGISGDGLGWVEVTKMQQSSSFVAVYRAMRFSGLSAGSLTISLSNGISGRVYASVDEFAGVDMSGTDGSGAIRQSNTDGKSSASGLTLNLGAFESSGNAAFGAFAADEGNDPTADGGFSVLYDHGAAGQAALTEWRLGQASPSISQASGDSGGFNWAGIALEIGIANN